MLSYDLKFDFFLAAATKSEINFKIACHVGSVAVCYLFLSKMDKEFSGKNSLL